jgi:hypothetical protein
MALSFLHTNTAGLPDFSFLQLTKTVKMYQLTTCKIHIPNGRKICKIAKWISGLKTYVPYGNPVT